MTDRALVGNAADTKQVKKAKQIDRQRMLRERDDLKAILGTVSGRRFIWKQLCEAGVFSDYTGDVEGTFRFLGRRSRGLALMAEIQAINPDYYHTMAKEAHDLDEQTKPATPDEAKQADANEEETDT